MKNRYDNLLRKYNQDIIELCPYNPILFRECAKLIAKHHSSATRVLELGSGEGDSALPVLEGTNARLDLLDISPEMNEIAAEKLSKYAKRIRFICRDAHDYLRESESYHIIYSAWTVHNFSQENKKELLETIYKNLADDGIFILLDKVYPAGDREALLKHQNDRYKRFLAPEAAQAIIDHEREDASDEYRMDEAPFLDLMKHAGFSKIEIVDRIERDVLLLASK